MSNFKTPRRTNFPSVIAKNLINKFFDNIFQYSKPVVTIELNESHHREVAAFGLISTHTIFYKHSLLILNFRPAF